MGFVKDLARTVHNGAVRATSLTNPLFYNGKIELGAPLEFFFALADRRGGGASKKKFRDFMSNFRDFASNFAKFR